MGFNRSNLGAKDLLLKTSPPNNSGAMTAVINTINNKGLNPIKTLCTKLTTRVTIAVVSTIKSASKVMLRWNNSINCRYKKPAENHTVATPTASIKNVLSSRERAICPSSRAFSSRRGEAGSVFSKSLSSAMAKSYFRIFKTPSWITNHLLHLDRAQCHPPADSLQGRLIKTWSRPFFQQAHCPIKLG